MAGLCRSQLRLMQDKSSWNYKFFLSVYKWFHCFCYVYIYFEIIQTEKKRPNNIQKTSLQCYNTQIKILTFPQLA